MSRGCGKGACAFDSMGKSQYYAALMSDRATLDAVQFAETGVQLDGEAAVGSLPRLRELVRDAVGHLRYRLTGYRRGDGKPAIGLSVEGTVILTCQRCLESMEYALDSSRELVFVEQPGFGELAEEEPDTDYLPAGEPLDLLELVEEEALLCLPMAPKHEAGKCPGQSADATMAPAARPFAVLSTFKKH